MPPAQHSCSQEQLALGRDLIRPIAPSSAPSCQQASEESGLRITASVKHWQLPLRRRGANILNSILLMTAGGPEGDCDPVVLLALPFDGTLLWVTVCFLGASNTQEEAFLKSFGLDGMEILSVDSDLN